MNKTAILFGATGLIGKQVLKELIHDSRYSRILVISRKLINTGSSKVQEVITGFESKELLENNLAGDEIFCCLGSTIRKAGNQEEFRKVDYNLPVMIGAIAKKKGINKMLVVSSLGADAKSSNFYLRTKGEMEQSLLSMGIRSLHFFRPSMLLGARDESRPAETFGKIAMQAFSFLFIGGLKKYKAIHAHTVAKAMVKVANTAHADEIYEAEEIVLAAK